MWKRWKKRMVLIRACLVAYAECIYSALKKKNVKSYLFFLDWNGLSKWMLWETVLSLTIQCRDWKIVCTYPKSKMPFLLRQNKHIIDAQKEKKRNEMWGCLSAGTILLPFSLTCFEAYYDNGEVFFSDYVNRKERDICLCPGYSSEFLRCKKYIGGLILFKPETLTRQRRVNWNPHNGDSYEWMLNLSELTKEWKHVPVVLHTDSGKGNNYIKECEIRKKWLREMGVDAQIYGSIVIGASHIKYSLPEKARVSIIIPNKDHTEDLRKCVESVLQKSTWNEKEILIIENGSQTNDIQVYYEELIIKKQALILRWMQPYNFAAICNYAARMATGEYLLFLNNDTEIISPNWIEEMLMYAQRADVGAVGAKLLYPDYQVQHAGVLIGVGGIAGHAYKHLSPDDNSNMQQLHIAHNCSAITGACMMIRKKLYEDVNGMDETLAIAYNDVDLCLRLQEAGYANIYTPYAVILHYESKSRGSEDGENLKRFERESAYFLSRWHSVLNNGDPYLHPLYSRKSEQFII